MLRSTDGHAWTSLAGSPRASGITSDGTNLYTSFYNDFSGKPVLTALQSAPTKWTEHADARAAARRRVPRL